MSCCRETAVACGNQRVIGLRGSIHDFFWVVPAAREFTVERNHMAFAMCHTVPRPLPAL